MIQTVKKSFILPEQFDIEKLVFEKKDKDNIKFKYDGEACILQFPVMTCPFGVTNQKDSKLFATPHDKYFLQIDIDESKDKQKKLKDVIEQIETKIKNYLVKEVYPNKFTAEQLNDAEKFYSIIKKSKAKDGKEYNDKVKVNIPMMYTRDEKTKAILADKPIRTYTKFAKFRREGPKSVKDKDIDVMSSGTLDLSELEKKRFDALSIVQFDGFALAKTSLRTNVLNLGIFESLNTRDIEFDLSAVEGEVAKEEEEIYED